MTQKLIYAGIAAILLVFLATVGITLYQDRESGIDYIIALSSISQAFSAAMIMFIAQKTYELNAEVQRISGKLTISGFREPIEARKLFGTISVTNHARIAQRILHVTIYIDKFDALEISLKDSKDSVEQLELPIKIEPGNKIIFYYEVDFDKAGFLDWQVNKDAKYRIAISTAYDRVELTLHDISTPRGFYNALHNVD